MVDGAYFRRLYEEFAPKLTNYLVGSGSLYLTACDIVQTAFLRLWERRNELMNDPAMVRGLLFTVARNYRTDLHRKMRREVLQAEITDETAESGPGGGRSPSSPRLGEAEDERAVLRARLDVALAELPPTLREAFTLFQLGELSIREIARQTGATETNVKVRIHRAKMKLRESLRDFRVTFKGGKP